MRKRFSQDQVPSLLLRIGLAFVLTYAAISALREPAAWLGFVPHIVMHFLSAELFLKLFAIFQLVLAAILLSGRYARYAAVLAAISMTGLVLFNLHSLIITFRDVGLIFMAATLFFLER